MIRAGTTENIVVKLNIDKPATDVDFILRGKVKIKKNMPNNSNGVFIIALTQEDTESLKGGFYLDAQINYTDKSARKIKDVEFFDINDTLGTKMIEGNKPSDNDGIDLVLEVLKGDVAFVITPESSQELIDKVTALFQAIKDKSSNKLILDLDEETYILTIGLLNEEGVELDSKTIDLPLESVLIDVDYDKQNKKLILTLQNGNTVDVDISDILHGLVTDSDLEEYISTLNAKINKKQDEIKVVDDVFTIDESGLFLAPKLPETQFTEEKDIPNDTNWQDEGDDWDVYTGSSSNFVLEKDENVDNHLSATIKSTPYWDQWNVQLRKGIGNLIPGEEYTVICPIEAESTDGNIQITGMNDFQRVKKGKQIITTKITAIGGDISSGFIKICYGLGYMGVGNKLTIYPMLVYDKDGNLKYPKTNNPYVYDMYYKNDNHVMKLTNDDRLNSNILNRQYKKIVDNVSLYNKTYMEIPIISDWNSILLNTTDYPNPTLSEIKSLAIIFETSTNTYTCYINQMIPYSDFAMTLNIEKFDDSWIYIQGCILKIMPPYDTNPPKSINKVLKIPEDCNNIKNIKIGFGDYNSWSKWIRQEVSYNVWIK